MNKDDKKVRKCSWCEQDATTQDYREVDGMVSKIFSCHKCFNLSTEYLLNRKYPPIKTK